MNAYRHYEFWFSAAGNSISANFKTDSGYGYEFAFDEDVTADQVALLIRMVPHMHSAMCMADLIKVLRKTFPEAFQTVGEGHDFIECCLAVAESKAAA